MAIKLKKTPKFLHFSDKQCPFTQNFAKQPNIFLFPKFLELFFTPKNTPPKVKNSKPFRITIFLGHPVDGELKGNGNGNDNQIIKSCFKFDPYSFDYLMILKIAEEKK